MRRSVVASVLLVVVLATPSGAFSTASVGLRPKSKAGRPAQVGVRMRGGAGSCRMSTAARQVATLPPMFTGPLPSHCRAVLFDIDGTLADSFQLAFTATNKVLTNHQYDPVDAEQYHYGCRFTTPVRLATHAGLKPDDPEFEKVGRTLGQEFDELYISLVDETTAGFYPGIKELIDGLPGDVKIGALTNAAVAYAEAVLKANGVRARFAAVHGADDVPRPKPAPDGLLQCLREMEVDPGDAVYIGDSPSDGQAALQAGCASVAVPWGANKPEALVGFFDTIVHSVPSLADVLTPPPWEGGVHVLLDRDGVVNEDVGSPGVLTSEQVVLAAGADRAISTLRDRGCRVSLVTNQNALGKGLLSMATLYSIHSRLLEAVPGVCDVFVAVGAEKLSGPEGERSPGAAGARDPAVLGSRKFASKPMPDIISAALQQAGSGPCAHAHDDAGGSGCAKGKAATSVLIGDNITDLIAGKRAGVDVLVLVTSSEHGREAAAAVRRGGLEESWGVTTSEAEEILSRMSVCATLEDALERVGALAA